MRTGILLMAYAFTCLSADITIPAIQDRMIEVLVVDELDNPVPNAAVKAVFALPASLNPWDGHKQEVVSGVTDTNGLFGGAHRGFSRVGVVVYKEGFYDSQLYHTFAQRKAGEPRGEEATVKVQLRKIGNPVPMYARRLRMLPLPATNIVVAYDLLMGDWVQPHGKGRESDISFDFVRICHTDGSYRAVMTLITPRTGDGFAAIPQSEYAAQSDLRMPRQAPMDGYISKIVLESLGKPGKPVQFINSLAVTNYFLRIRSVLDEKGRVKQAMYGKIAGPIQFTGSPKWSPVPTITLGDYYVNPDGTRNTEYDRKRNLFKAPTRNEESALHVTAP